MAVSMTGFGSASKQGKNFHVKCDVQCLNKKNLEIFLGIPKNCIRLEIPFRKTIEARLKRGKVSVFFEIGYPEPKKKIVLDKALFDSWQKALRSMAKKYSFSPQMDLNPWIGTSSIWRLEEERIPPALLGKSLAGSLNQALDQLQNMRKREGKVLEADLLARLKKLENHLKKVEQRALRCLTSYRNHLRMKVGKSRQFSNGELELFNRFVSVFTDKNDVTEEITRLKSHFIQMRHYLKRNEPVGRRLDFILQECNREANTIGSKLNDLQVSKEIVSMKSLLEQVREQVQNLL